MFNAVRRGSRRKTLRNTRKALRRRRRRWKGRGSWRKSLRSMRSRRKTLRSWRKALKRVTQMLHVKCPKSKKTSLIHLQLS